MFISHIVLIFHSTFNLKNLFSHCFTTFFPFHKLQLCSHIGKFWYIYVIGIKINKKVPRLFQPPSIALSFINITFLVVKLKISKVFRTNSAFMKWPLLDFFRPLLLLIMSKFAESLLRGSIKMEKNSVLKVFGKFKFLRKRAEIEKSKYFQGKKNNFKEKL